MFKAQIMLFLQKMTALPEKPLTHDGGVGGRDGVEGEGVDIFFNITCLSTCKTRTVYPLLQHSKFVYTSVLDLNLGNQKYIIVLQDKEHIKLWKKICGIMFYYVKHFFCFRKGRGRDVHQINFSGVFQHINFIGIPVYAD